MSKTLRDEMEELDTAVRNVWRAIGDAVPRWVHRSYAALLGYGWFPCPACGAEFGGHEATGASIPDPARGPGAGKLICPHCARLQREAGK